jgi:hypothetical protein
MKTILPFLLTLALCCASFETLHAQMTDGKPRFGLKLGLVGANLYDDQNADDKKSRVGFTGGVFGKIPFANGRLALRPELLFATKGAAFDYTNNLRTDLKLNYVELPISLEFRLLGLFNLHAGMHAALLANAEGELEDAQGNAVSLNFDKEAYNQLDYGWHLGGGIDLGNIGLHLRISRGLQEIGKEDSLLDLVGDLKNAAWALTFSAGL